MRYQKNKELSDLLRNQFLNKKFSEKRTVEEAVASRRAVQDAKNAAPSQAPPLPYVRKPAAPQPRLTPPGPASSDADEMDLELAPDESKNELLDRLPLGWEKKLAVVDRKWFLAQQNEFITDLELKTYVHMKGWADSSNSGRKDWLRIIVENLDAAEGKEGPTCQSPGESTIAAPSG
jgi:hypothetical protein